MSFSEFLGNARIVTALRGMLAAERVPHAMLFSGPRGVGKFTLARMFAQAANCERLRDDFCGECEPCRRIGLLADLRPLIEQGLAQRGERPDAATVERVPLLLETHPDVWAIVPDPVRAEGPRRASRAARGAASRRAARRLFQAAGTPARLYPRWRGNHALGSRQYFSENSRRTARIRDADPAGAESVSASADDPVALPAIFLYAAGDRRSGGNSARAHGNEAGRAQTRRAIFRRLPRRGDGTGSWRPPQSCTAMR